MVAMTMSLYALQAVNLYLVLVQSDERTHRFLVKFLLLIWGRSLAMHA